MVRHGESEANRDLCFSLSSEVPLTELGRLQARELTLRVARLFQPERVISSPFTRALQTAEIVAGDLGLPLEIVDGIQERDLGCLKGQPYEMAAKLKEATGFDPKCEWLWRPDGGESREDVRLRVSAAIERVRIGYPDSELLVVTHGVAMLSMWAHVMGTWDGAPLMPNCGIMLIDHDGDGYIPPPIIAN